MTKITNEADLQELSAAVSRILQAGGDLQGQVRDLMLAAFSSGRLDLTQMRRVTRAVLDGIESGAERSGVQAARQSLAGVSDALMQAAEASRLAIEEAAGRAAEFGKQDLHRAVEDLRTIEQLFADTLRDVAGAGTSTASSIFNDYLEHIRRGNTALGNRLEEIASNLAARLAGQGGGKLQAGMALARETSVQLAALAGAALSALQEGLTGRKPMDGNDRTGDGGTG